LNKERLWGRGGGPLQTGECGVSGAIAKQSEKVRIDGTNRRRLVSGKKPPFSTVWRKLPGGGTRCTRRKGSSSAGKEKSSLRKGREHAGEAFVK